MLSYVKTLETGFTGVGRCFWVLMKLDAPSSVASSMNFHFEDVNV